MKDKGLNYAYMKLGGRRPRLWEAKQYILSYGSDTSVIRSIFDTDYESEIGFLSFCQNQPVFWTTSRKIV